MKLLPKLPVKIKKLIMIAPPLNSNLLDGKSRPALDVACDWKFDFPAIVKKAENIIVLADENDDIVPAAHTQTIAKELGVRLVVKKSSAPHFEGMDEPAVVDLVLSRIKVFTTRPDTLFGATYMVFSPEHELIDVLKSQIQNLDEVEKYREQANLSHTNTNSQKKTT